MGCGQASVGGHVELLVDGVEHLVGSPSLRRPGRVAHGQSAQKARGVEAGIGGQAVVDPHERLDVLGIDALEDLSDLEPFDAAFGLSDATGEHPTESVSGLLATPAQVLALDGVREAESEVQPTGPGFGVLALFDPEVLAQLFDKVSLHGVAAGLGAAWLEVKDSKRAHA